MSNRTTLMETEPSAETTEAAPLRELLTEELRDILHAEGQLVAALPKMAEAAHHPKLKEAFIKHLQQTEEHVERLKGMMVLATPTPFEPASSMN